MVYSELMKNLADSNELMAFRLVSASSAQQTFHSYFLDMVYVEFTKNFHLTDSSEVICFRLISPPQAKTLVS